VQIVLQRRRRAVPRIGDAGRILIHLGGQFLAVLVFLALGALDALVKVRSDLIARRSLGPPRPWIVVPFPGHDEKSPAKQMPLPDRWQGFCLTYLLR
jgi:hypothetical protein